VGTLLCLYHTACRVIFNGWFKLLRFVPRHGSWRLPCRFYLLAPGLHPAPSRRPRVRPTASRDYEAMCRDYYTLQFMDPSVDTRPIAPALQAFFDDVLESSVSEVRRLTICVGNRAQRRIGRPRLHDAETGPCFGVPGAAVECRLLMPCGVGRLVD
jgi:hypothetical protein